MNETIINPLVVLWTQLLMTVTAFLPKLLATVLILLIGITVARSIKFLFVRILEKLRVSSAVKKTPVEHFFDNDNMGHKVEEVIGNIVYWFIMLVVLHTVFSVLGLSSLSLLLEKVIGYLPNVLSAIVVLFFGVLLAGLVESFVKGAIKTIDGKSSRLFGKIASYLIVTITILAAISELGIARDFVIILFIGFVSTFSLAFGLALGLGGKDVAHDVLQRWYDKVRKEIKE